MSDGTEYLRATTLEDALAALAKRPRVIAAGCTDLFPATERKRLPGDILDISAVPELRGITAVGEGLRLGAATTWADVVQADLPAAFDGLKQAASAVGGRQIQNRGTLAGNLCNASPAADGVPPLLTLDASVEMISVRGKRQMPLAEFLQGPRQTALEPNELLTAILIPQGGLTGQGNFLKLGARDYLVISIAMTAVRLVLDNGAITKAAVAIGACGPVATRLPDVENALIGQRAADAVIDPAHVEPALSPIDDVRASADYRLTAATELLTRCVRGIADPKARAA